jgi:hypothetical protein
MLSFLSWRLVAENIYMPQQEPNWQPLTQLPLIATMIDGMTESAEEQLVNLQRAEARPHVLDNATVDRLIRVYTEQKNDLWLYAEQLTRWGKQSPTAAQRAEITRLEQRLSRLRVLIDDLLARGRQLRPHTIDAILAKSDAELGLDVLSGKLPLPTVTRGRPRKPSGEEQV